MILLHKRLLDGIKKHPTVFIMQLIFAVGTNFLISNWYEGQGNFSHNKVRITIASVIVLTTYLAVFFEIYMITMIIISSRFGKKFIIRSRYGNFRRLSYQSYLVIIAFIILIDVVESNLDTVVTVVRKLAQ